MQLKAEKIVAEDASVLLNQSVVKLVGVVDDTACNTVNVEGNAVLLDEVIKGCSDGGAGIKEPLLGYGKAVLKLKAAVCVQQSVFLKPFEAIFVINVEKFHIDSPYVKSLLLVYYSMDFGEYLWTMFDKRGID